MAVPSPVQGSFGFYPRSPQWFTRVDSAILIDFNEGSILNSDIDSIQSKELLSEEIAVQVTLAEALFAERSSRASIANAVDTTARTLETLAAPRARAKEKLLHDAALVEELTKKLFEGLEEGIHLQAFKEEDVKSAMVSCARDLVLPERLSFENPDAGFYLYDEIVKFKDNLLPAVQSAVRELEAHPYSKDALIKLCAAQRQLAAQQLRVTQNLPSPRPAIFRYLPYLLEAAAGLAILIVTILVCFNILSAFTVLPSVLVGLICLGIKGRMEKKTLPDDNKDKFLKNFAELHAKVADSLKMMEEEVSFAQRLAQIDQILSNSRAELLENRAELLENRAELHAELQSQIDQILINNRAELLENRAELHAEFQRRQEQFQLQQQQIQQQQEQNTQKLLDAVVQSSVKNASTTDLIDVLEGRELSEREINLLKSIMLKNSLPSHEASTSSGADAADAIHRQA